MGQIALHTRLVQVTCRGGAYAPHLSLGAELCRALASRLLPGGVIHSEQIVVLDASHPTARSSVQLGRGILAGIYFGTCFRCVQNLALAIAQERPGRSLLHAGRFGAGVWGARLLWVRCKAL